MPASQGLRHKDRVAFTERFIMGTSERELGQILGSLNQCGKTARVSRPPRRSQSDSPKSD